ncbi:MAG: hypothetical protein M3348_07125 [Acidobacteriota bacterium]|nr:hypothetical protein [Acidobacteriota bacterium]
MRQKFAVLLTLSIAVVAVAVITSYSGGRGTTPHKVRQLEEKGKRQKLSFAELAQLAKARGERQVVVPGVATLYPNATTPEELNGSLPEYAVFVAEMVAEKSYLASRLQPGGESPSELIKSWYKFKVLDAISEGRPHPSFAVRELPTELLPVAADEVLVPAEGGTVVIDGVEVTQHEESVARFRRNRKYLLLLSVEPATRVGELAFGPQSVLPLSADGGLDAGQDQHILQRAIKQFHGGSIRQLKAGGRR